MGIVLALWIVIWNYSALFDLMYLQVSKSSLSDFARKNGRYKFKSKNKILVDRQYQFLSKTLAVDYIVI